MDELGWLMLVLTPLFAGTAISLLLRRGWRRIAAGMALVGVLYAGAFYQLQIGMIGSLAAGAAVTPAAPSRVALEAGLMSLPFGLSAGVVLHFITRSFRTQVA